MEWMDYLQRLVLERSFISFIGAFGGGILASFTPCIYPVLPIVVSFLGHQSARSYGRKEVLKPVLSYFAGLSLTYGLLGAIAVFSGKMFGFWAGNRWLYLFVGNVCLAAGFVMLEWIRLPGFLNGSISIARNREGLSGAFIMGATSSLVIGPCTTPIFGTVISIALTSDTPLQSLLFIMGFSFGMGFPILVLGIFTGFVAFLPRSGPWLVTVQKICGFAMVILAQYFFVRAGMLW